MPGSRPARFGPDSKGCKSAGMCESNSDCPSRSSCQPLYAGAHTKRCRCNKGYSQDSRYPCKSDYLTTCSKLSDCFTAKSMDCVDGVCRCSASMKQIYEPNLRECIRLVGSPCGTQNNGCVDSAYCSPNGICRCPPGTTLMDNGKCSTFLAFGENCTEGIS